MFHTFERISCPNVACKCGKYVENTSRTLPLLLVSVYVNFWILDYATLSFASIWNPHWISFKWKKIFFGHKYYKVEIM